MPSVIFNVGLFLGSRYWGDIKGLFCVSAPVPTIITTLQDYYTSPEGQKEMVVFLTLLHLKYFIQTFINYAPNF